MVKEEYMNGKAEALKKQVSELKMTEDDLVPLQLLHEMFLKRKERVDWEHNFIIDYLKTCQGEVTNKIRDMKVENEKIKKVIESNVTINYLNKNILLRREEIFRL